MIRLLIFDLDGTLVDSAPDIIASTHALLKETGRPPLTDQQIKNAIGMGTPTLVAKVYPGYSQERLVELTERFYAIYEKILFDQTYVYPGLEDFLRTSNLPKIAIVTNKAEYLARELIARSSLRHYPWLWILGGDSLPRQKPDPLPLWHVIELAGVTREETVMIGDGLPDMGAALRAGVHSVGLTFGYSPLANLLAASPSLTIDGFAELPAALRKIEQMAPRELLPVEGD